MKTCFWCGKKLRITEVTRDHLVSKPMRCMLRGPNLVVPCCKICNRDRGKISGLYKDLKTIKSKYSRMHLRVEKLAYQYWEEAGRPWGRELEFWCRAEIEVCKARKTRSTLTKLINYRDRIRHLIHTYRNRVGLIKDVKLREVCFIELNHVLDFKV